MRYLKLTREQRRIRNQRQRAYLRATQLQYERGCTRAQALRIAWSEVNPHRSGKGKRTRKRR